MSVQPPRLLEVRKIFQDRTNLSASSLGILHYVSSDGTYRGGGGYHAGNDLLAMIGKLNTDYSKRESERDRPGSNYGSAIDIGRFRVTLPNGRVVTNHDMTRWMLAQIKAGAPDTKWIREIIYSLDDKTVQRYDALNKRSSGDPSHTSHEHYSCFRDDIDSPHIPGLFNRFWAEMEGKTTTATPTPGVKLFEKEDTVIITFIYAAGKWGMGIVSGGKKLWLEFGSQDEADAVSLTTKLSADTVAADKYENSKAQFVGIPA